MENQPDPAPAAEANMPGDMPAPAVEMVSVDARYYQNILNLQMELEDLRRRVIAKIGPL